MKLNYWRIGAKAVLVAVLTGVMVAFERLVHPVMSAGAAVGQLADTVDSNAQMTAYGWVLPVGWTVVTIVFVLSVFTEVRAIMASNKIKEVER